jgi:hypothetical protein
VWKQPQRARVRGQWAVIPNENGAGDGWGEKLMAPVPCCADAAKILSCCAASKRGGTAAPAAGLLIFTAIGEKNAPVAALIEISYPLAAAFFTWLFFRESHLNLQTMIGAALIYAGIIVVALGNRG